MNKLYYNNFKAGLLSLLIVVMLCLTSIAVPITDSEAFTQITNQKDELTFKEFLKELRDKSNRRIIKLWIILFEKFYDLIFKNNDLIISNELIETYYNFLNLDHTIKNGFNTIYRDKTKVLKNAIDNIINDKKSLNDFSPEIQKILTITDTFINNNYGTSPLFDNSYNNKEAKTLINNGGEHLKSYMRKYEEAKRLWGYFGCDNMHDWLGRANWLENVTILMTFFFFLYAGYIWKNITDGENIAFILITAALLIDVFVALFSIKIHAAWHHLEVWATNINMRVICPRTTGEKEEIGINNLEHYLIGYNIDIANNYSQYLEEFTYYFGPVDNADVDGWYSLDKWYELEDKGSLFKKPPLPPGSWHIIFEEHDKYDMPTDKEYRIPIELLNAERYSFSYELDTNPNTPNDITILGDSTINVGEIATFQTSTYDPNPQDSLSFCFHWGNEEGDWSTTPDIHSGDPFQSQHSWDEPGCYEVKVKARDNTMRIITTWSNVTRIMVLP